MTIKLDRSKTFRFELVKDTAGVATPVTDGFFNLLYPPESYSIKEAPRYSIMKLFGDEDSNNINIDDFGDDNKIIRMKGTTGSPSTLRGYTDPIKALSGQEAMKAFRDRIINWRSIRKKQSKNFNADEYKVRLYNYFDNETYFVFITNFEMEKSASKPLFYTYSMEMITVGLSAPQKKKRIPQQFGKVANFIKEVQGAVDGINSAITEFNNWLQDNPVTNFINDTVASMQGIVDTSNLLLDTIGNIGPSTIDIITENIANINSVIEGAQENIERWKELYKNGGESEIFHPLHYSMRNLETEWTKLSVSVGYHQYKAGSGKIPISEIPITQYLDEAPLGADDRVTGTLVGTSGKTLNELVRMAKDQLGVDIDALELADFNGITGSIVPDGLVIRVPNSKGSDEFIEENQVITTDKINDYLGTDMKIVNGAIAIDSRGDLSTISSVDNVLQAVDNRLTSELGAFVKLPNYGFDAKSTIGNPNINVFLQTVQLKYVETVELDPRIELVDNVVLKVGPNGDLSISGDLQIYGQKFEHKFTI